MSNVPPAIFQKGFDELSTGSDHPDYRLREVSAYDALFSFDMKYSREQNFFDHFISNLSGT